MGNRIGWMLGSFLSVSLLTSAAMAQDEGAMPAESGGAHYHDGFFLRLGLNIGPLIGKYKLDGGPISGIEADYSGITFGNDILIGGTPVPGLVIGGALITNGTSDPKISQGSFEGNADGTMYLFGIGAFVDYYIDPASGFNLQALLGFAGVSFVTASGQSSSNDPTGLLFGIGAGYDFWIGDEWSVGPFARFLVAPTSSDAGGGATNKFTYMYPSIGVAFTLH